MHQLYLEYCDDANLQQLVGDIPWGHNLTIMSLVALELKVGRFKPEYAGKMNFYLVREPGENPSIGIILCTERDHFEVEYALLGLDKPVGVSEYLLTRKLPPELANKLPDAEYLAEEIRKEIGVTEPCKLNNKI